MKRILLALVLLPLCAWLVAFAAAKSMRRQSESRPWPDGLRTIHDVPRHFSDAETSAAALELTRMTAPLGISITPRNMNPQISPAPFEAVKEPLRDWLTLVIERRSPEPPPPPPVVQEYLSAHAGELDRIREHILTAGPIAWAVQLQKAEDAPLPDLLGHMSLTRLLVARAVLTHSWDDLHAVWLLNRSLWERPELISILIGLAAVRTVNAVAARMPLPAPEWLRDVQSLDYRHRFAACYQAEAWRHERIIDDLMSGHRVWRGIIGPWLDMCAADAADVMCTRTTELMRTMSCDLAQDPIGRRPVVVAKWNAIEKAALPGMFDSWNRLARFRAELETTSKALELRSGRTPSAASTCSDGTWIVRPDSIAFSRQIAPGSGTNYPLAYERY